MLDVARWLFELAEKMGLLAAAAVVAVFIPPLRNRLLGVGQRRDRVTAVAIGLGLSVWGTTLGFAVLGEPINLRAIGVLIAAVLGGTKAGALTGLGGGLFCAAQVDPQTAPWVLAASVIDGAAAGRVASRFPQAFRGARTFASALLIQLGQLAIVGGGLLLVGHASRYGPAWPAHLVKITVNAAGVTLFVLVARLVAAHEAAAVALVEARAAADAAALDSLRRRLEPHFLFNALNTLRATIRRDPRRARDLVLDLADLYRYLLRQPEDATLADEVAHARHYLEVERARLGDGRLQIRTEIPAALAPLRVPAFLLQPLVENAVRHGIARRAGGGEVCICASRGAAKALCISVEDRSPGPIRFASEPGHGIALDTLRQRLYKRFGAHASLTLYATETGMRAVVRLDLDSIHASPPALERAA